MNINEACKIMKALDPMDRGSVFNGFGLVCYAKVNGWPIDADKLEALEAITSVFWEEAKRMADAGYDKEEAA